MSRNCIKNTNACFVFIIFFFCLSSVVFAQVKNRSEIIKIVRTSPVFERASAKSKIIADVDQGSSFFLIKTSPKGLWLFVEDEDGNKGWVPSNRTNYSTNTQKSTVKKTPHFNIGPQKREERSQRSQNSGPSANSFSLLAGVIARQAFDDPNGQRSYGVILHKSLTSSQDSSFSEPDFMNLLSIGAMLSESELSDLAFPLKYSIFWHSQSWDSFLGPDLGVIYFSGEKSLISLSVGLNILHTFSNFYFKLRPGFETFEKSRFSVELELGGHF